MAYVDFDRHMLNVMDMMHGIEGTASDLKAAGLERESAQVMACSHTLLDTWVLLRAAGKAVGEGYMSTRSIVDMFRASGGPS